VGEIPCPIVVPIPLVLLGRFGESLGLQLSVSGDKQLHHQQINLVSEVRFSGGSFINIRKSRGPRTEPWGTPLMTGTVSDVLPSATTC